MAAPSPVKQGAGDEQTNPHGVGHDIKQRRPVSRRRQKCAQCLCRNEILCRRIPYQHDRPDDEKTQKKGFKFATGFGFICLHV
jgi:hypothetical protein